METVKQVDIPRFMGRWYVQASIPTLFERHARAPIEDYRLLDDGRILTTFSYHDRKPDGPLKSSQSIGFVDDPVTNARWKMQIIWPFRADYRIVYLDEAYQHAIIGRMKRDYLWIMSRSTVISETDLEGLMTFAGGLGYNKSLIRIHRNDFPLVERQASR